MQKWVPPSEAVGVSQLGGEEDDQTTHTEYIPTFRSTNVAKLTKAKRIRWRLNCPNARFRKEDKLDGVATDDGIDASMLAPYIKG